MHYALTLLIEIDYFSQLSTTPSVANVLREMTEDDCVIVVVELKSVTREREGTIGLYRSFNIRCVYTSKITYKYVTYFYIDIYEY